MRIFHLLWAKILSAPQRFRWFRWWLYQRRLRRKPRAEITNTITIYAHEFGSDSEGDGTSVQTAYRTFIRARRDIPDNIAPGTNYRVDVTGLHIEKLPTDFNVFASEEAERKEREIQRLQALLTDATSKQKGDA